MSTQETSASDLSTWRDEELLALVARRHEPALGALYDRYGRVVFTIGLRITGDRQTAEEVVQDVFQNIWQSAGAFQPGAGSFTAWLFGITRHRAIDTTRSKRERSRTREQAIEASPPLVGGDIDRDVDQALLRDAVRLALADLPLSQRQAVELAYYGDLTRAEIAERLGEPLGTVKTRLRLGLAKLRDLLRPFDE